MSTRSELIHGKLEDAFEPSSLLVKDQSHLHAGHAGARDGRGHFHVAIVSKHFSGMRQIAIHQAIYAALGDLMETDIHALSIKASAEES